MKYLLLSFIVFIFFIPTLQAQQSNQNASDSTNTYKSYMKKRNTDNVIGTVCLATGLTVGFVGALEILGTGVMKHTDSYKSKANATFIAGNVIAVASIPFFVIANDNKKKAKLSLGSGAFMIDDKPIPNTGYAKLSLTIRL